jgi:hypothetical protein
MRRPSGPNGLRNKRTPNLTSIVRSQADSGRPDREHVSTSFVELQTLTMRMSMRRFTRLTSAFFKKVENHAAAVALHFIHYNFARIHKTLRINPAMAVTAISSS